MTRNELDEILHQCYSVEIFPEEAAELIWGQFFEGETERITKRDEAKPVDLVTKSASLPKPKLAHLVTKSVSLPNPKPADLVTKSASLPNQKPVKCEGHCRGDARCTGVIQQVTIRDCSGKFGHYNYCHPAIVSQRLSGYIVEVVQ